MIEIGMRDLRRHGAELIDRVEAGERVTITRAGRPVAELLPLRRLPATAATLLDRWSKLPYVDPAALRTDLDGNLDSAL